MLATERREADSDCFRHARAASGLLHDVGMLGQVRDKDRSSYCVCVTRVRDDDELNNLTYFVHEDILYTIR